MIKQFFQFNKTYFELAAQKSLACIIRLFAAVIRTAVLKSGVCVLKNYRFVRYELRSKLVCLFFQASMYKKRLVTRINPSYFVQHMNITMEENQL